MTAALSLHPRVATTPPEDRGPMLTAAAVANLIWEGKYSKKWVAERMGPAIGFKLGKAWHFYEDEAKAWKHAFIERQRGRA